MKLTIKKSQTENKGMFGGNNGMSFILSCQVELTSNENKLIEKYKVGGNPIGVNFNDLNRGLFIGDLTKGQTYSRSKISEMFEIENETIKAIKNFNSLLNAMNEFDGEKVIEV